MTGPLLACAGERGSFAEDAALAFLPACRTLPVPTFGDVFAAVADGRADGGVVPIENVIHGTVREVYDLMLEHRLVIAGEVEIPIHLCLAALPTESLDDIERVYSHVQALAQAEPFLHSRPWSLLASTTTSSAGRQIAERRERRAAAVLSRRSAALHGLAILADGIQAEDHNRTRFLVLAAEPHVASLRAAAASAGHRMRTTLAFGVVNEPGSLLRVLSLLAARDINISKLESRPSRDRAWEYVFWLDVDADLCGSGDEALMSELGAVTAWLRRLGCYPVSESVGSDSAS